MLELVGRITALDPAASESLKVVTYFDALVESRAPADALLRAASALTGCAAGFVAGTTAMRVDEDGARTGAPGRQDGERWPGHVVSDEWRAWIEREGAAHANDEIVLERLSLGLGICLERTHPIAIARRNLEILIDPGEAPANREAAATRLRLGSGVIRLAAAPIHGTGEAPARSVVVGTPFGRVRAILIVDETTVPLSGRHGLGVPSRAADAVRSWKTALLALRMTSSTEPAIDATELGSILFLAEAADASATPLPDVLQMKQLVGDDSRTIDQLDLIARAGSIRAAAIASGVHHSTMQARVAELSDRLGFDVRSSDGRVRLILAIRLYRLATTQFP